MLQPRLIVLVGVLGAASGWGVARVVTPAPESPVGARQGPRPIGVSSSAAAQAARSAAPVAPATLALRLRLDAHPATPVPGRNPFVFAPRATASLQGRTRTVDVEAATAAPASAPAPESISSRFHVSGIATTHADGAAVFTAVLTDRGTMIFVSPGDRLPGGYLVSSIDDTAVVLIDATGTPHTLRLP